MSKELWVISDTHFSHENIIKYCDRPFSNSKEMDEYMIEKWNSVVKDGDKVYHLGDVYMGGERNYITALLAKLHGSKRLILGNHDNGKDQILQSVFKKIDVWRMFPEFGLLLTHVPVHPGSLRRGETGNEKNPKELTNVHGHIHNALVKGVNGGPDKRYQCACVEHWDYRPINIEELRVK